MFLDSGVDGLNELLGGFIKGSTILLIGPVGTLKDYLGGQFIYAGLRAGERCLYISTWESEDEFTGRLKRNFGWDLRPYVEDGLLKFHDLTSFWMLDPSKISEEINANRVVGSIFGAKESISGGRILLSNLSHLLNFTFESSILSRLAFSIKVNAKRTRSTAMLIMDEGAQDKSLEENVKSICSYVLTTAIAGEERRIRILRAPAKHGLEWHRLALTNNGVKLVIVK